MERINYNSFKFLEFLDNLNPQNSGILFSTLLHLIILVFALGLPNFFGPKDIYVPNIIPIEILNISETTNIEKTDTKNEKNSNVNAKQKKFNSSDNLEIQKQINIQQNIKSINDKEQPTLKIKENNNLQIQEKKNVEPIKIENKQLNTVEEVIKKNQIKPKLKPKPKKIEITKKISDVQIEPKTKKEVNIKKDTIVNKPKQKPEEDFSIASMLKDLRNEKSNNIVEDILTEENDNQTGKDQKNENMILSITEIDLLRQQLSACWNAPAGAVIERGMKVTISAKVQQNMRVLENSVRIIDTNISKSNTFYGPITDSAMRTLLNPECTPLKLPKDKYNLWKNLTITFDYSIMKGY